MKTKVENIFYKKNKSDITNPFNFLFNQSIWRVDNGYLSLWLHLDLTMGKAGAVYLKPRRGGREQEVTNLSRALFSSSAIPRTTLQNAEINCKLSVIQDN